MTAPGFSFQGRIGRANFVLWWLLGSFSALAIVLGFVQLDAIFGEIGLSVMGVVLCIPLLLFVWSLYVRRLHDFNASGWWSVLFLVPYLGALFVLPLFVIPGTEGLNRYDNSQPSQK